MKKIIYKLTAIILCFSCLFQISSYAEDYTKYANELKQIELFNGTDKGFELDKELTRAEAATMIVRLLGKEIISATSDYVPVFTDVKETDWHYHYVMYCYENDITKGTGNNQFSPNDTIGAEQFITLMLRTLGYTETEPETAYSIALKKSLFGSQFAKELQVSDKFLRNEMVYIAYRSLKTKTKDGEVLAVKLGNLGVLTQSAVKKFNIYEYEDIEAFLDAYTE